MAEQVLLIEARFKSKSARGSWVVQAMEPFMDAAAAESRVDQLRKRNTLSEWRARPYAAEPSPEPEAAPEPQQASAEHTSWSEFKTQKIIELEAQLAALKTCLGECVKALEIADGLLHAPLYKDALANAKALLEGR